LSVSVSENGVTFYMRTEKIMTELLQQAFTIVSMNFSPKEQERFAHL